MKRSMFPFVFVVLLLLGLAACGGRVGVGRTGPPLSKDVFVAKGNAICQQLEQRVEDFANDLESTRGDLRKFADFLYDGAARVETDLRALNPPAEDEATVDSMLERFHSGLGILKEFAEALSKGDPSEEIDSEDLPSDLQSIADRLDAEGTKTDEAFDRYGLTSCGSGFGD